MAVNNSLSNKQKTPFSLVINSDGYKKMINNTLKDSKRAAKFVTAITSAVVTTPTLAECEAATIVSAGLLGETLNLSPSPQLGQYYLVPFKDKKAGITKAQFVLGYKGYIQLAVRSGYYKKLNVLPIKQGELIRFDPLEEEIEVRLIEDEIKREQAETMGYYAMFEYSNGFRKALYWSKEKMESHADKYSQAFSLNATTIKTQNGFKKKVSYRDFLDGKYDAEKDSWMYSSYWYKDFDGMACKTMLRQLLSKWGIMSIDLHTALENDNAAINVNNNGEFTPDFVDTADESATDEVAEEVSTQEYIDVSQPEPETEETSDFGDILEG